MQERIYFSIRKNDRIQIVAGREKGKSGKVLRVDPKNNRILVEKLNMVKRHVKPSKKNPQGGILEKEAPIHYSNVLLFCPKCNDGVRHGRKWVDSVSKKKKAQSKKIRYCKKCNESLDVI